LAKLRSSINKREINKNTVEDTMSIICLNEYYNFMSTYRAFHHKSRKMEG